MKNTKKFRLNSEGFTLLEILVVLTIMGFLIAMVAPRLAGISGGAVDTVCDTNQNRMITYMSSYFEKTARFPNRLTNLVVQDGATTYRIPSVSDEDPDNGPETLAAEFYERNYFKIHVLDADEASELRKLGVVTVLNLNSYDNYLDPADGTTTITTANEQPAMAEANVEAGVGVAMIGLGHDGTAWDVESTERGWGEPDWFGRIILGMGPESGLIKSGIIGNAAHCPGGLQNTDNATYNDYNLVLPRLESTISRFNIDGTAGTSDLNVGTVTDDDTIEVTALSYDDDPGANYDITTNDDNLRVRTFNIAEVQESWQYATQCPEGHMYPEDDGEFWAIDLTTLDTIE